MVRSVFVFFSLLESITDKIIEETIPTEDKSADTIQMENFNVLIAVEHGI